ncbi:DUF1223 domain-containing protein [Yoonia sediminilitoris]|uniref:Secreted protein n=1 Tax=Yoonia sediminilitoris TaxID=1286148 RepID=A0A2T6KDR0_9RHOB|nr:DUF1223 domain-containing protein [Yoonia sediminilitoris]PUB13179.1 hypothetical protein C8N45_108100 [Yoonia sediminilitoris]RCW94514.1 hypothetical protein DFP92_108101 [Yoonia sediminilitoris]
MRPLIAAIALGSFLQTNTAMAEGPVVVELFTSQGCSSCPPADAFLHGLAGRDDVIALALHVDYWDYIGWADIFANPAYTARQHAYARAANATTVYTPQMVINGQDHVIGSRPVQVMEQLQYHQQQELPVDVTITRRAGDVQIQAAAKRSGDYVVQLVRYTPEQTVAIKRGENAGKKISYSHIVYDWQVVGQWDGVRAFELDVEAPGDEPVVVIVQEARNGPIVGAAQLR